MSTRRTFPLSKLRGLAGEDRQVWQVAPGLVSNGHWMASCKGTGDPLPPERVHLAATVARCVDGCPVALTRAADQGDSAVYTDAKGNEHYLNPRYARGLLAGLTVVRLEQGKDWLALHQRGGRRHQQMPVGGVNADGVVIVAIMQRERP